MNTAIDEANGLEDGKTHRREGLKPCPFCGGEAFMELDEINFVRVVCSKCLAMTASRTTDGAVRDMWNRRAGA